MTAGSRVEQRLWADPGFSSTGVDRIDVTLERRSCTSLNLVYRVQGRIDDLVIPSPAPPVRADRLWETTCFEAFVRQVGANGYRELNFSPSSRWAAYDFSTYRAGMVQAALPAPPAIVLDVSDDDLILDVTLSLDLPDAPCRVALTAVLQNKGGAKSYWAANHPSGSPDFHHPACFTLDLPPPPGP